MTNSVHLNAMEFKTHTDSSYGFNLYDEYECVYDDLSETMIEGDMALLEYAMKSLENSMRTGWPEVIRNQNGMYINLQWYPYEAISGLLR